MPPGHRRFPSFVRMQHEIHQLLSLKQLTKNLSYSETVSERKSASFEAISIALVKMPLLYYIITHGSKSRNELWERKRKFFSNFFLSLSPSTNVADFFPTYQDFSFIFILEKETD